MAAVTATVRNVMLERGNDDARAAAIGNLKRATVYLDSGGTDVVGGTDTLDCNLATAIQSSTRNGLTVSVQGLPVISQAITTDSSGTETTRAGYMTLSTNTVSITPKTNGYLTGSTNGTVTGAQTVVRPYGVYVVYTEA